MLVALLSLFLAEVLLLSGLFKAVRRNEFLDSLSSYTALRRVPRVRRFAQRFWWGVPVLEAAAAVILLIPATRTVGSAFALMLFLAFYLMVGTDDRPLIANCGCWGQSAFAAPKAAFLVRNLVLLATAGVVLMLQFSVVTHMSVTSSLAAAALAFPFSVLLLEMPNVIQVVSVRTP